MNDDNKALTDLLDKLMLTKLKSELADATDELADATSEYIDLTSMMTVNNSSVNSDGYVTVYEKNAVYERPVEPEEDEIILHTNERLFKVIVPIISYGNQVLYIRAKNKAGLSPEEIGIPSAAYNHIDYPVSAVKEGEPVVVAEGEIDYYRTFYSTYPEDTELTVMELTNRHLNNIKQNVEPPLVVGESDLDTFFDF